MYVSPLSQYNEEIVLSSFHNKALFIEVISTKRVGVQCATSLLPTSLPISPFISPRNMIPSHCLDGLTWGGGGGGGVSGVSRKVGRRGGNLKKGSMTEKEIDRQHLFCSNFVQHFKFKLQSLPMYTSLSIFTE